MAHVSHSKDLTTCWPVLAVFPADFDEAAAAAVWQMDFSATRAALAELAQRGLVQSGRGDGRWQLSDQARHKAGRRLSGAQQLEAQRLHAERYGQVLGQVASLSLQAAPQIAADLFDCERANIEAGQRWAAQQAGQDEQAARLCMNYLSDGSLLVLQGRLPVHVYLMWATAARTAAHRLQDQEMAARSLGELGLGWSLLHDHARAIASYEQALALTEGLADRALRLGILNGLGDACRVGGQPSRAMAHYEQLLSEARANGYVLSEGFALANIGQVYMQLALYEQAIGYAEQALALGQATGYQDLECSVLNELGMAYAGWKRYGPAKQYYEQALALLRARGPRLTEGLVSWNLGLVYEQEGDLARAAALMQVLVDYERQIGDPKAEADAVIVEEIRRRGQP